MHWHLLHDGIWENMYWPLSKILYKAPSTRSLSSCMETCNVRMCFVGNRASDQAEVCQASLCRSQSHRIRLRSALWFSEVIHSRNQSWCPGKESSSKLQNQTAWCYIDLPISCSCCQTLRFLSRKQQKITAHWTSVCSWAREGSVEITAEAVFKHWVTVLVDMKRPNVYEGLERSAGYMVEKVRWLPFFFLWEKRWIFFFNNQCGKICSASWSKNRILSRPIHREVFILSLETYFGCIQLMGKAC